MNAIVDFSCHAASLPRTDEVLSLLLPCLVPVSAIETVVLAEGAGRILAGRTEAALDVPPCDRSAMDGYAFRFGDTGPLRMSGSAPAGKPYAGKIAPRECIAITTGGMIPEGCDTVAMREHCERTTAGVSVSARAAGANIRRRGEDFRAGDTLLQAGIRIGGRQIALLAAAGVKSVTVRARLRIAILSMGEELAEAAPDGIRDANRPALMALCIANGFEVTDFGILPDSREGLAEVLARAAVSHDIVLTTAGTSAGDEDHIRGALMDCGGRLLIAGVAIKPGKPISFGQIGGALCVALPGNPAAAYVTFLVLGLPLLRHLSGRTTAVVPWHRIEAGFSYRKKTGLREYLRVRLVDRQNGTLCAERCGSDSSAALASLAAADGMIVLMEDQCEIREGELVPFASFQALETA